MIEGLNAQILNDHHSNVQLLGLKPSKYAVLQFFQLWVIYRYDLYYFLKIMDLNYLLHKIKQLICVFEKKNQIFKFYGLFILPYYIRNYLWRRIVATHGFEHTSWIKRGLSAICNKENEDTTTMRKEVKYRYFFVSLDCEDI